MLEIAAFEVGPVATNAYLLADRETGEAAVIDPAWDGERILAEAIQRGWRIGQIWYTHAHFDHLGGVAELVRGLDPAPRIAMHALEHSLWEMGGGGALFGFPIDRGPEPGIDLAQVHTLRLGGLSFEVRHTPGHSPGHCIFYCAKAGTLFSGDLIFQSSVGRTDLLGSDPAALLPSIRSQVFNLPDETRILPGHGPETTVGEEKRYNPFVRINDRFSIS